LQGALSSILAMCPSHFILAIIIFTMLCYLYMSYNSSLYFILYTPLTQLGP
jgi:hypothetical protein